MSQHDYDIANQQGAPFRADLNAVLAAIQSANSGGTAPANTVAYMPWADTASGLLKIRNAANSGWVEVAALSNFALPSVQKQLATAFTTTGTSTAYLLTPAPAIAANTAGTRFRVNFHTSPGANATMAVSGQTALPLKYKDGAGVKQAITSTQVPSNWTADVETDGTDWLVLDVPPTSIGGAMGVISAAALLAQILTVDGAASALDADLLDGKHASEFAGANANSSWVEVWNSGYSQASYQINCRANFGEGVYWGRNDAAGNFYSAGVIITNGRGSTHDTTADYTTNDTSVSTADVLGVRANLGTARIYKLKKDA